MGFQIERVNEADAEWVAVDYEDNLDLDEPFEVLIKPMTGEDLKKTERANGVMVPGQPFNPTAKATAQMERIVKERCVGVRNLVLRDRGASGEIAEVRPADGEELLAGLAKVSAKVWERLLEIVYAMIVDRSKLTEAQKKRSSSRSVSN